MNLNFRTFQVRRVRLQALKSDSESAEPQNPARPGDGCVAAELHAQYISCPRLQVASHPGPAAAGSSEVQVTQPSARPLSRLLRAAAGRRPSRGRSATPGQRDSRLEQPVVVHPGNMGGAGDEALNSWRHRRYQDRADSFKLTPGSRPVIGVTWLLYFEETFEWTMAQLVG